MKEDPTYRDLGDHSEAIQIDFDPEEISYAELLEIFWDNHNPTWQSWSRQYRNILFYHNEEQKKLAEEWRDRIESKKGRKVTTDIVPYMGFYFAEDYHQKHTLRRYYDLLQEFTDMYPATEGIVSSTAAARVNGYLAGEGKCNDLEKEIGMLGLSEAGQRSLLIAVCGTAKSIESSACRGGTKHCPVRTRVQ